MGGDQDAANQAVTHLHSFPQYVFIVQIILNADYLFSGVLVEAQEEVEEEQRHHIVIP